MGWASGSKLMGDIIDTMMVEVIDYGVRVKIYKKIITAMENHDWDTQDECLGVDPAFDLAIKKIHPDWDLE